MPVFSNVDEARLALNETATLITERATSLASSAIVNLCLPNQTEFPISQHGTFVLFKNKTTQEDLFFLLYKEVTKSLAPLFYNNDCPLLTKDCVLTLWGVLVSQGNNPMKGALLNRHDQLKKSNEQTEEVLSYKKRLKLYDEYHVISGNGARSTKAKEIRKLANEIPFPSEVFASHLHELLTNLSHKAQQVIDVNKAEVSPPQKATNGMSP